MNALVRFPLEDVTTIRPLTLVDDYVELPQAPKENRTEKRAKVRGAFYLDGAWMTAAQFRSCGSVEVGTKRKERDVSLKYADKRLAAWSEWAKQNRRNLGYPTISALFRVMMDSKRVLLLKMAQAHTANGKETRSFREEDTFIPDAIAEIDAVVARLPRPLERVITANYFTYGSIEVRASASGHKRARFSQLLEAAKYSVWVALDSKADGN